jgi:DNA-3-methyladenine glycosylase
VVLPRSYYLSDDVLSIARSLLGKVIFTSFEGKNTSAIITETEAYAGVTDKASHAFGNRRTARTEVMFAEGGLAYVYLCYGIHHLFNVVTNAADIPHAVLIRAGEPLEGIEHMLLRRHKTTITPSLTSGPGALSAALGIRTTHSGISLNGKEISIHDMGANVDPSQIIAATRVGVAYAGADALLPYRFYIAGNRFVSKAKGL